MPQYLIIFITQPHLCTSHDGSSSNRCISHGDFFDALVCFLQCCTGAVQGIEGRHVPACLFVQARSLQDGGETRGNEIYGFEIRTCVWLVISTLTQYQYTDHFALCSNRSH